MDASLQSRVEQFAEDFAGEATTIEELNGLMRLRRENPGPVRQRHDHARDPRDPPRVVWR
jgi:hypothetical protein